MIDKNFKIIFEECNEIYNKKKFSFLKGKKILITGATGLIGQYLIGFFLQSINSSNKPKKIFLISKSNLPKYLNFLKKIKYFKHKKINLSSDKILDIGKFDYIVHGATYAQPLKFTKNDIETITLNTTITNQLIKKLVKNGKFLFISSSELYSGLKKSKLNEEDIGNTNPSHMRACYIESKRCGEAIVNSYRRRNINAKSARLCLAFGPGVKKDDQRVLNEFIKKGLIQKKIVINGGGKNIRAYIYISDAIKMLLNILFFGKKNVYNVGGSEKISILKLAKIVAEELNVPFKYKENKNTNHDAPNYVQIDINKYKNEFKKINFIKFKKGLQKTIGWYKQILKKG
jgi:UDP-glucuronate decarboxylase